LRIINIRIVVVPIIVSIGWCQPVEVPRVGIPQFRIQRRVFLNANQMEESS
jgi:hypothetical protein